MKAIALMCCMCNTIPSVCVIATVSDTDSDVTNYDWQRTSLNVRWYLWTVSTFKILKKMNYALPVLYVILFVLSQLSWVQLYAFVYVYVNFV